MSRSILVVLASAASELRERWRHGLATVAAVAEVTTMHELYRAAAARRPPILLLDLELPGLGRLDGVRAILRVRPATPVVAVSGFAVATEAVAALSAGARGYCSRDIDPALLKRALGAIQNGELWVTRSVIPLLLSAAVPSPRPVSQPRLIEPLRALTNRERQVAELVGFGASNKEVATALGIREPTVKVHLTAIFRKLGISGRLRLALAVADAAAGAS